MTPRKNHPDVAARQAFGAAVARIRRNKGLTAKDVYEGAGLTYKTYRRIEDGLPAQLDSVAALDGPFGWPVGTALRAYNEKDPELLPNDDRRYLALVPSTRLEPSLDSVVEGYAEYLDSIYQSRGNEARREEWEHLADEFGEDAARAALKRSIELAMERNRRTGSAT